MFASAGKSLSRGLESISPDIARSDARLNDSAVTSSFEGGEKRNPSRIANVYVRPPFETSGKSSATSGTSIRPLSPSASG